MKKSGGNARIGYEFYKNWRVTLDVFNLFDSKVSDVDYYYTSRLAGEPPCGPPNNCDPSGSGGYYNDIHTHPEDPREARVTLTATF